MKYTCIFLMMLGFLNFNAQGTWKHIKYNEFPSFYSTLAYTHSTDLSNGNTVIVGINVLNENEIYEIITILDKAGKPIRDIESQSLGSKVLMYVQDMPLQQKFFYVGFDLLSSTWYLTHMDYQGDIIKVDSIKSNSSLVEDFIFSIKKRDNGNIILSTFSYLGVGQSILCELTPEGTFLQTHLVETSAPTIFIPKSDNTGYVCFGDDIFEMDDKFNVTNVSNEFQFNELSSVDAVRVGDDYFFIHFDNDGSLQLVKLNSALEIVKQKELAFEAFGERFYLSSMTKDNDGNILIGSNFIDEFTEDNFVRLYKVDGALNVIFEEDIIDNESGLLGLSISPAMNNSILLSGFGFPIDNDSYSDAYVFKLDHNGKLSSIGYQTELSASSVVYPNPATDLCKINFPAEGLYDLKLVNVFGQEIYCRLTDITANTATIDLSNVCSGLYFLQISQANQHMESIKLVKI